MRIGCFVFLYALMTFFANISFAEKNEVDKFLFHENSQQLKNLNVVDINDNEINIINKDPEIVTVATGRNNPNKILAFFKKYNLSNLENYRDPKGKLALELGVIGLPFSVIISKEKRNIGQLIGPIDWSKKEVEDLFIELVEKES